MRDLSRFQSHRQAELLTPELDDSDINPLFALLSLSEIGQATHIYCFCNNETETITILENWQVCKAPYRGTMTLRVVR